MLAEALLDPGFYAQATSQNSLIIARVIDVPVEISHDLKINGWDLSSSHEEADVIIAQLAVAIWLWINHFLLSVMRLVFLFCWYKFIPDVLKSGTHDHGFTSARQSCD